MEEFDIAGRFHSFQRETENDPRYHHIKDEEAYRVDEMIDRESPNEILSSGDQRLSRKRTRNWTYDQIMSLIKLWSQEDVLYNVKNPSYHDKDSKTNAINNIVSKLVVDGVNVTADEVTNKMHSLRVYFANKRNKLLDSKKTGNGQEDIYKITWPYYESLMFLNDNVVSRSSSSNNKQQSGNNDRLENHELTRYEADIHIPAAKVAKRTERGMSKNDQLLNDNGGAVLQSVGDLRTSSQRCREDDKSDDEIFCELIYRQLKKIPDGASKDFFKLDLYRFVISNTYRNSNECSQFNHPT